MATVSIRIRNQEKIMLAFQQAPRQMGVKISQAVRKIGVFTAGETKKHITAGTGMWKAPIRTGQMRQGIHADFQRMKSVIRPSFATPYATFVHEGTKFMRKRPFFEITAQRSRSDLEEFFNREMEQALKDIFVKV
jgi:hypothetical protein